MPFIPISNDFASAPALVPGQGTAGMVDITDATSEGGLPESQQGTGGGDVWWRWVCPDGVTQDATVDTFGSADTADTVLNVWAGPSYGSLVLIGSSDDSPDPDNTTGLWSQVTWTPVAGTIYHFQVASWTGGQVRLNFDLPGPDIVIGEIDVITQPDFLDEGDERALRMLSRLPPYFRVDPLVRRYVSAWAKELNRLEWAAERLRYEAFPQRASLASGTLPLYERQFRLAVLPGSTEAERQASVVAYLRARRVATRFDWTRAVTAIVGDPGWRSYEGPAPYTLNILLPFEPSLNHVAQIQSFVRAITPAHLQIAVSNIGGFKVGISRIGIDPL